MTNNFRQENSGNWTVNKCKEFLSKYGAPKTGRLSELEERCVTIIKLQKNKLDFNSITTDINS